MYQILAELTDDRDKNYKEVSRYQQCERMTDLEVLREIDEYVEFMHIYINSLDAVRGTELGEREYARCIKNTTHVVALMARFR